MYNTSLYSHSITGKRMPNRRGHGEGAIYPIRRDGKIIRWASSVELGHVGGKRRRRVVYARTRKEVSEKLKALHNQQHEGTLQAVSKLTVGAYLIGWLDSNTKRQPTTIETYRRIINTHVIPRIGGIRLDRLTSDDVAAMIVAIVKEGHASTASQARRILKRAFKDAVKGGKLRINVVDATDDPRVDVKPAYVLSEDEARKLVAACEGERFGVAVLLGLLLGYRQGEIKGSRWSDIDWEQGTIQIARSGRRVDGARSMGPTKSKSGVRGLPLVAGLKEILRQHQIAQAEEFRLKGLVNTDDLIVASQAATMYDTPNYLIAFRRIVVKAGLPITMRPHDLRHSTATILIMRGVDPKTAAAILGHANSKITMDIYAKATLAQQRKAAETMDRAMKPKKTKK